TPSRDMSTRAISVEASPQNQLDKTGDPCRLLLIDGIGPFFRHYNKKRINWSKIPFSSIETSDGLKPEVVETVPDDFRKLVRRAKSLGYNAVTLDDVAHLIRCEKYADDLQRKIEAYRELFGQLMAIAEEEGLAVFFTMDVMFFNESIREIIGDSQAKANSWLLEKLSQLFCDFPWIAGVIMRFGESDGLDVKGDFRSQLWLKRPADARRLLEKLLPMFEQTGRLLIFRTWSVGAHPIGDLSWNKKRFRQAFDGLGSRSLVISLKYGESDFFRYLPVNPLFFVSDHQKIVEFQARREYEGFGAYPSFVGWDSEEILRDLRAARNLIGMSVWCQTGGWGKRRQLTFLRNSPIWVELNTCTLARLWQGKTCEQAIDEFVQSSLPEVPVDALIDFLRRSEIVIKDLLYVRELAQRQLYFRRLRLPPQLFVYWDRILVDPMIKKALSCLVRDHSAAIEQGHRALAELQEMIAIAESNKIPTRGLKLQLATFEIIATARDYFFSDDEQAGVQLQQLKTRYKKRFKRNYSVFINLDAARVHRVPIRWILPLMVRERSSYRILDQVLTVRLLGLLYPLARRFRHRIGPKFASQQAMGLDTLLK
ncbi:MAG: hypothetical protein AAFV88_23950, partial [Planctomycetota bacterium]